MSAQGARRIGLFGGAFDPVHDAHIALARAALEQLSLDEVRWIPAGQPWYKSSPLVAAVHRIAMVALAIEGEPRFVLDTRETERTGPTYTLDTVMEMQAQVHAELHGAKQALVQADLQADPQANQHADQHANPKANQPADAAADAETAATAERDEWFLIIGQDQLAKFHTWQGWQALVSRVALAVAGRAGEEPLIGPELAGAPVVLARIDMPPMTVSSTQIRERLAKGEPLSGLVPDSVARYIARHGLYLADSIEPPRS